MVTRGKNQNAIYHNNEHDTYLVQETQLQTWTTKKNQKSHLQTTAGYCNWSEHKMETIP